MRFRPESGLLRVIVNHECQPFDVELTLGSAKRTMKVDLTCGG